MTPKTHSQPNLPGIDVAAIKMDALVKDNPTPTTVEMAELFLRKRTVASLNLKKDHDILRVVLKNTNEREDDIKFEVKAELPLHDRGEWERLYIATAKEAHAQWLRLEEKKQ